MRSADFRPPAAATESDTRPSAFDRALGLLGRRAHFRAELERKLLQRGYPEAEIAAALDRLTALGYLDDAALAAAEAVRLRERKSIGRARTAAELSRKGAGAAAIAAALANVSEADELERARAATARWLSRHHLDRPALARHLDRKGFAAAVVRATLHSTGSGEPDDPPDAD